MFEDIHSSQSELINPIHISDVRNTQGLLKEDSLKRKSAKLN